LPRKTDSRNPADWLWLAETELAVVCLALEKEIGFTVCRSKLAEILEKILKAELIRLGWPLEKTHDLERLLEALVARRSDLGPRSNRFAMSWRKSISPTVIPVSILMIRTGPSCEGRWRT
jgi:hypothetical protein